MRILITGGSGFIGRNLIEHFSAKYKVLAPAHAELELLDEDAVRKYLTDNQIEIVLHGAVQPGHRNAKNQTGQLYNNTRMFFNLARSSGRFKKMICLSSGLVYDQRFYQPKMKENYIDSHVPFDEGGFSKYIAAKYVEKADNIVELRVFGVFGKYEDYAIRFISNMICKALFGLPLTMKQNRKFDYISIEDLIPVIDYFINHDGKFKAYNVSSDQSEELKILAEKVREIAGKNLPINVAQPGMGTEYSGDNSRLKKEIKNFKLTPIEEGIRRLYAWYSRNKGTIDRECLLVDK